MSEINTAEQFLIAEYNKLQQENDNLQAQMKSLLNELAVLKSTPDVVDQEDNPVEHPVSMWKLDEPIEVAYLNVKDHYDMRNSDNPLKLTADEIRKHIDENTLDEIVDMSCGYSYFTSPLVYIDIHTFPYTLRIGKYRFGLSTYMSNGRPLDINVQRCEEDSSLRANAYFPIEREQELFEHGLTLLKEQLKKHLKWLEDEGKSGKWWEDEE